MNAVAATGRQYPFMEECDMSVEGLLIVCLIGGIAGWLAGLVVKGYGFGVLGNIVIGIIGAFVGSWLLGRLGIALGGGYIAAILNAMIGAIVVLLIIGLFRRRP
jgi:uncharacterized membrane protein YeaQ/YmgE (transglycosylase-associated protein family)